jgi:signal transduction histidine kinase
VKLPVKLAARLIEAFGTATFRTSALVSVAFAATTLALFAFIFWQTAGYERSRVDQFLRHEVAALVREPAGDVVGDVDSRYAGDLHRQSFAAVFTPGLGVLGGTLAAFPRGLPVDGRVYLAKVLRQTAHGTATEVARLVARTLPDRRVVVVGRSDADLAKLRQVVWRALELGLAPGVALALLAGTFASLRMLARAGAMNAAIERIMTGALDERLPTQRGRDGLDRLAASVNRMLDEIGRLLTELQGVGDDIAHELRTPLSRARSRLEGGRERAATREALVAVVDRAIGDLDQTFATITALLRIRQIESARRRDHFSQVSLGAIVREAEDLYLPMAELRELTLEVAAPADFMVFGDRDLLFEAVANLLDNAVKFAPQGGLVRLSLVGVGPGAIVRVQDSGPGVRPAERDAVLRRFYRSDHSARVAGTGLGLSLVQAILHLHGYGLTMHDIDGMFAVDVECR